jgi:thiol-disulfide isomerase/thioredoxin
MPIVHRMRHAVIAMVLVLGALVPARVPAADNTWYRYDQAAFERAKADGQTVVLVFHAPWCPICRAQMASLRPLLADPEFAGLAGFIVDYDSAAALRGALGVTRPATLIVYKGMTEVVRGMGLTDAAVRALVREGLGGGAPRP